MVGSVDCVSEISLDVWGAIERNPVEICFRNETYIDRILNFFKIIDDYITRQNLVVLDIKRFFVAVDFRA